MATIWLNCEHLESNATQGHSLLELFINMPGEYMRTKRCKLLRANTSTLYKGDKETFKAMLVPCVKIVILENTSNSADFMESVTKLTF